MNIELFEDRVIPVRLELLRFAYRMLGNSEEAKDVVQDVFVKVWNGRDRLSEIQNIEGWCKRLTKNLAIDKLRSRKCRKTESMNVCFDLKTESLTPYEHLEVNEHTDRIMNWINVLPEKQREIIHLRDVQGYSYNEISESLGIDLTKVKVRLFRARQTVKEKFVEMQAYGVSPALNH